MGFYFEDFNEGDVLVTVSRTVTETDVVIFAGLSGDYNQLHTDEEYAKTTVFGGRIAHGFLGLSIASGLTDRLKYLEGTAMAILGINWKFVGAIRLGDTIHVRVEVESKRESKKTDRGIVTFFEQIINQKGEVVQEGQQTIMVRRRQ
ncbi:MAG: MaoC family dehydratase N-terminal domain-containing protein [Deltaproteobacteria bacterium]|nr:MaoC family dehydratase N-terminal domain-containing protein [Deltaproteobacteria bacterium]